MTTNVKTTVIDAGGRYGLHPTWKPFTGELDYYSFEPDPEEARRLKAKYAHRANEIKIIDRAVAEKDGKLKIALFRNRAMSSSCIFQHDSLKKAFRSSRIFKKKLRAL